MIKFVGLTNPHRKLFLTCTKCIMACTHLPLTCILRIVIFILITLDIKIIFMSLWQIVTCMQKVFIVQVIWNEIMNKIEVSISFPQFKIVLKQYLLVNNLKT